ncbi:MAG: hypothetical protein HY677_02740 [Chloroflexi bacterium]|nr:hypothetical protein [Chloroflexota bacterium]
MRTQNVFILYSHPLFAKGIETLLRQDRRLRVVGMETDEKAGMERIAVLQPDVVIVDADARGFEPVATARRVFKESPESRIIELDIVSNGMRVYNNRSVPDDAVRDLIRAIKKRVAW